MLSSSNPVWLHLTCCMLAAGLLKACETGRHVDSETSASHSVADDMSWSAQALYQKLVAKLRELPYSTLDVACTAWYGSFISYNSAMATL